jgi:glycosyltransferase involved in cell wall biosynthesis
MESVLSQIDEDFEVVVVDNFSSDGTLEYLKILSREGKIRLILAKCNRGQGRQIALEHARGKYVMAKVDFDLIYRPLLRQLMEYFIEKERVLGDYVSYSNVIISSKRYLMEIGGWRPLQWGENYELYKRLIDIGKLYLCNTNINSDHIKFKHDLLSRLKTAYVIYRDSLIMGLRSRVVAKELRNKYGMTKSVPRFLILGFARFASSFYEKYDTFEDVTWEEFYRDNMFNDSLGFFELRYPDKVLPPLARSQRGFGK